MTLKTSDFFYDLPPELIAQEPATPRDSSRLLVYESGGNISHRRFYDIGEYLRAGDLLVLNNTRVIPARLLGISASGAAVEILLLKRLDYLRWEAIAKPAKRARLGAKLNFGDELSGEIVETLEGGIRIVEFSFSGVFEDILNKTGAMPLPPYIKKPLSDRERYQTVYSKIEGSAAAPTAGFHWTPELIEKVKAQGVEFAEVLLHIGLSTFRPVKSEFIEDHKMHSEYYEVSEAAAEAINRAKAEKRRVIAVGTTAVRTLESAADESGVVRAGKGATEIFIYPPYKFKTIDGMITNFHLPESTLIMLVSAFLGREETLKAYNLAVAEKYRFFSFGDACLLLP
ncbi:MAG TPA: tRNA preQ1(34) S-adenosylmethionine ribosyltransferase-isomerase QueA [Eubacteriales bacterium]|jgi:S-adenosylmethionine:tRNA ribosyltransferase-isomerase|nr:tRNA preQ1(34) S-adenosylmethionine ribosyltransferase-isomerase QueA [Clostridia bacterium]HRR89843.1 tRNA preQ1(34) S-adenosylmethionine ribosyltransferase-isomerase QueA [Eubacteriales bacterium]HRU85049.1 tRNA preQ1(34) S-adenosylmethionine ribosyltransferase-isomerase QueA [Eubacteriales bacterium]